MAMAEPEIIGEALDKLFTLQGKRILPKDERKIFIDQIEKSGLPLSAIVAGINALVLEEIKSLTIGVIMRAIRSKIEPEERPSKNCRFCSGAGAIFMRDPEKRSYSLACRCENGANLQQAANLMTWNGEETQFSNGRMLTLIFPFDFYFGKEPLKVAV